MKIKSVKIISLLLAVLLLIPLITGCSEAGRDLLMGFVQEWFYTKFGIDTTDTSMGGKIMSGIKIANLLRKDSTGNPDADAALGTVKMVLNFAQAENQMTLGRNTNNATAMDAAIKMRPGDWSYHASRSTLALKQNDTDKATAEWRKGEDLAYTEQNPKRMALFYSQSINELETWKNTGQLDKANGYQQAFAYGTLTTNYARRYNITRDAKDKQMAEYYNVQWNNIAGLEKGKPPDLGLK